MLAAILRFRKVSITALAASLVLCIGSPTLALDAVDIARVGFQAKNQGDYARAIQLFDEAMRVGNFGKEQSGFLLYSRGVAYEGLGNRDRALIDLDAAIALLPNFPNAYIYRSLVWAQQGQADKAIDDLIKARGLSPNDPLIYNNLGGAYETRGDFRQALESYNTALQLRPAYPEAYYNRARTFLAQGDHARALSDYDQAIWLQPKFADAIGNRAALHLMLGDVAKALADFDASIALKPFDAAFRSNRAHAFLTVGRYDAALVDFDEALRLEPGNPALYLGRGRARLFAGEAAASVEDLKTAVRIRPSNAYPVIWLHIARVHSGIDDKDELTKNVSQVSRDAWPVQLLDYYLGVGDAAQTRLAAQTGAANDQNKRVCEAEFFLTEFDAHIDDRQAARSKLTSVAERCRQHDVVFSAAIAELKRLAK